MRFWRPPLYHWSYWPSHASAHFGSAPAAGKAVGLLLRLLVLGVLAAPGAELRLDQLVGHGPLVLGGRVVPLLAHVALERDDRPVHRLVLLRLEPTTRIELVTSSLPRTCSTD